MLIDNVRHDGLTRKEHIGLFEATYIDPVKLEEARELCMPCIKAVLDVAFKDRQP